MTIFKLVSPAILISALIAIVNILTEVTKRIIKIQRPERVVVAWATAITASLSVCAAILQGWTAAWMLVIAVLLGLIAGALVAYAAMFGYDDLYRECLQLIAALVRYVTGSSGGFNDD